MSSAWQCVRPSGARLMKIEEDDMATDSIIQLGTVIMGRQKATSATRIRRFVRNKRALALAALAASKVLGLRSELLLGGRLAGRPPSHHRDDAMSSSIRRL
jgi:hypothetical protein